jgi:hypothetical protein
MVVAQRVALGDKNVEIARDMGLTPEAVSGIRNSPEVKAETARHLVKVEAVRLEVQEKIADQAVDAVRTVANIMGSASVKAETRLRAALGLLDRNGNGPTQTHNINPSSPILGGDDIAAIRKNGRAYIEHLKKEGVILTALEVPHTSIPSTEQNQECASCEESEAS